jgi:hypothetical protein
MVDIKTGAWRGDIPPAAPWFAAYQTFITGWATKATAWGADSLSVGCEFKRTEQTPGWDDEWRNVIAAVRANFAGPLTYAANHDSYDDVVWWDDLDFIGIDAYLPLTNKPPVVPHPITGQPMPGGPGPTLAELETAWNGQADLIEDWWLNALSDAERNPILFTEVGYTKWFSTNKAPYQSGPSFYYLDANGNPILDGSGNPIGIPDLQEQARCYAAALGETWTRDWMAGYYWWMWDTQPGGGGYNPYTPQGNPAYDILVLYYTPEPSTCLLLTLSALALTRRRRSGSFRA